MVESNIYKAESWLRENAIINGIYSIQEIGNNIYVDIKGSVRIREDVKEMPYDIFSFRNVSGDFSCKHSLLKSLKGGPERVEGNFDCSYCKKLEDFSYFPSYIGKKKII